MIRLLQKNSLYFAWIVAFFSVSGSLFFSEIAGFPPCILCWYQRVCMYPILVILTVGILNKDKKIHQYILPLSIIGALIGLYHNLLYYSVLPESNAPCVLGISCTTKFIEWFGFITIPFLSLLSFVIITLLVLIYKRLNETRS